MTDHHDAPDLLAVDERARAAARGLEAHVLQRVDVDASLQGLVEERPARRRGVAAAAVILLLVASFAVIGRGSGDERSRVDVDSLPDLEAGVLTLLGPRDGRDSLRLPITAEPSTGLHDGDTVVVSGTGFEPGERVGIVQCAREAGGDEVRGGVDGCNLASVQYADADENGATTGTFTVRRVLTTPMTGTVDCAAEDDRCIVAIGALDDYDRSGGTPLRFVEGGAPLDIPTADVSPREGLEDGQVVAVSGDGFQPGELLDVLVCSTDPSGCWSTGQPTELEPADQRGEGEMPGLRADPAGRIEGQLPVWRYLPGSEPGTYIDCAVSSCTLRIGSQHASPATIPLSFTGGGRAPEAPVIAVEPSDGVAAGDEVVVRGEGFEPGNEVSVMLCGGPAGQASVLGSCTGDDVDQPQVADDGSFVTRFRIPSLEWSEATGTTACAQGAECASTSEGSSAMACGRDGTECSIVVSAYSAWSGPPTWSPAPVTLRYR